MGIQLVAATISITLALVLYTVGVFSERASGTLGLRHVLLFWGGLAFDTTGTAIMSGIAGQSDASAGIGVHGVTGMLAIALMLVHALWATVVYLRRNERSQRTFHTFSTLVWLVWLVPYVIGTPVGMLTLRICSGVSPSSFMTSERSELPCAAMSTRLPASICGRMTSSK